MDDYEGTEFEEEPQDDAEPVEGETDSAGSAEDSETEQQTVVYEVVNMTPEQLTELISAVSDASATKTGEIVLTGLTKDDDANVTTAVMIEPAQYRELRTLLAADLNSWMIGLGLLSLLLGAVIAVAVTLHWRAR